jgi:hypothetical protein
MAFNITSWGKSSRDFARGAPPPPGSFEWAAVGDVWQGRTAPRTRAGWDLYEIKYTELDAAKRWIEAITRGVRQARDIHGDKILTAADASSWSAFLKKWSPFATDMSLPGHFNSMLKVNKKVFDDYLNEARALYDGFVAKGISPVPIPYANELLTILRNMPKQLTATEMASRLRAGSRCGEKMLDENTTWWTWISSKDHGPLLTAIGEANQAARAYEKSRDPRAYKAGSPPYDEVLRRLTRIWVEAAGLSGIVQYREKARAEMHDQVEEGLKDKGRSIVWVLVAAGVGYLGISWLGRRWMYGAPQTNITVGVPDAIPREETIL